MKLAKKVVALVLASAMVLSLAACGKKGNDTQTTPTNAPAQTTKAPDAGKTPDAEVTKAPDTTEPTQTPDVPAEVPTYTYNTYSTSLGNNWNPHTWETNADDSILGYLSSPFCTMQVKDSEEGVYQWVYEMATSITDVTAAHQDDLTKYNCTLPSGKTVADVTSGYVFEIALNKDAKWQDGTPINADSYIYSMKALLDPSMKNYRSNLYWGGESAVAGGLEYYYAGDVAYLDNGANAGYTLADCTKGDDGQYVSPDGNKMFIGLYSASDWCGGDSLGTYVEAYGDAYFDVTNWEALAAMADDNGLIPLTDENYALFVPVTTGNPNWGETEDDVFNYFVYAKEYPVVGYDETVGCYKVDDYTIRYVNAVYIDFNYFLTSCTSTWLVYEPYYEATKNTEGKLVTSSYGTKIENTMSYGPYKLESLQNDKQIVFTKNENWYGYEKKDGRLVSTTPYLVDGEHIERYQTDKIVIDVMTDDAAKQAFLKGQIDDWTPSAEEVATYATSDRLYKVDETYTQSFFFNTGLDALKEMDKSKGNTNSVVLSNINFRKAFSLSVDRTEWVTATAGYKPAYATMNNLYFYDIYNDPSSSFRNSDEAMQAICNVYGVKYGEGTPYATLKDAYKSINGYNLTEAKALMKQACDELVADGLYTAGQDIVIRVGYKKGGFDSSDNKQLELFNKYINAAAEGSGFGKITLEGVDNVTDRYGDTAKGEFAIGYGAWGGAAFYPFRNFQVYCDPDNYALHEAGCWDPTTETLTINVNGEDVTMTWQAWSGALIGNGAYSESDFSTKLYITAKMEEEWLKKYYRIPFASSTACSMLSYKLSYYTEEYNIMYDFGGLELMSYNYSDKEWADYIANNTLSYE